MNNKIRKFQFSKVIPQKRSVCSSSLVTAGINKAHTMKDGQRSYALKFGLHPRAMEQAGFNAGDCLDFTIDGYDVILTADKSGKGRTLTCGKRGSERGIVSYGKCETWGPWNEVHSITTCSEVEIVEGAIAFRLPF